MYLPRIKNVCVNVYVNVKENVYTNLTMYETQIVYVNVLRDPVYENKHE